ncbi:MAG: hypothetical protein GF347_03140 [Candidatus Moranbacteria bacterium]|nr:hypothetical protein [Candidatus Moranbacteria bacterium]
MAEFGEVMGVIGFFSKKNSDDSGIWQKISAIYWVAGGTILDIKYSCSKELKNPEKYLVYDKEISLQELAHINLIDPHFGVGNYSPVARFEHTKKGLRLATLFLIALEGYESDDRGV